MIQRIVNASKGRGAKIVAAAENVVDKAPVQAKKPLPYEFNKDQFLKETKKPQNGPECVSSYSYCAGIDMFNL